MSTPIEHEYALSEPAYPYQGLDDGISNDLPPLAPGPYSSFYAPDGSQDLPSCYPVHSTAVPEFDPWAYDPDFQFGHLSSQYPYSMPTPISEGFTYASMLDGCTQLSYPFALPSPPLPTLSSETQSRIAAWPSTGLERDEHNPEAPLLYAKASSSAVVLREKEPTVKGQFALDEMKVVGKPRRNSKTGELEGIQYRHGRRMKHARILDSDSRLRAAKMRQFGACRLCRESKKQCNLAFVDHDYQVCKSCANSPLFKKDGIFRMPCFKSPISAAEFFRLKPSDESPHRSTRRVEVYQNEELTGLTGPAREIQLTQGIKGHTLTLWVSEFIPLGGDKIAYTWEDAKGPHSVLMPQFCITNVEDAKESIKRYVRDSRWDHIRDKLREAPRITQTTFEMALKSATQNKGSLVQRALDIWSASRIIEDSWYICGSDTLGAKPVQDPANPCWHEKVPVTPIMDTQLDQFVIQEVLMPRKDTLLTRLQCMMEDFKREAWFELFITIFVLLSSIEAAGAHQRRFARRYGYTTRFANHKEMLGFFHGCKIFLAYFHFVCRGALPIQSLNWNDSKSVSFAQLNEEQVRFMEELQRLVRQSEEYLRNLRPKYKYDHPLYWCHQLFFGGWKPGEKEIEDEIP